MYNSRVRLTRFWSSLRMAIASSYWKQRSKTGYSFTFYDVWLFFFAKMWQNPGLKEIKKTNKFILYEISDYSFYWPSNADPTALPYIFSEIFTPHFLNPHSYEWGKCRISPNDWVIDVGACEGFFTRYAFHKKGNVCVIEAVPDLIEAIKLTLSYNKISGAVLVNGLLGNSSGSSLISIDLNHISISHESKEKGIPIRKFTLDELINQRVIPRIDFIKADVEGAELEVIKGAVNSILKYKPKISLAVYHRVEETRQLLDFCELHLPDYNWKYKGFYAWDELEPRPYMLYGWTEL